MSKSNTSKIFVSINLSGYVKDAIYAVYNGKVSGLRPIPKKNLHLTLAYLGEISKENIQNTSSLLSKIKSNKFKLELSSFDSFTSNVLFLNVSKPIALTQLHKKITNSLNTKSESFNPHITIARNKKLNNKGFVDFKNSLKPINISFEVNSFELMESTISKDGSTYKKIKSFELEDL